MASRREYPDCPMTGVGGVVISNERALLIRRDGPPLQGEWSIPGGMLELGETLHEGVRRELAEETGLVVRVLDLIEIFERISRDEAGICQYHFVIADYLCEQISGEPKAASDVIDGSGLKDALVVIGSACCVSTMSCPGTASDGT